MRFYAVGFMPTVPFFMKEGVDGEHREPDGVIVINPLPSGRGAVPRLMGQL